MTLYSARIDGPSLIVRGVASSVSLTLERDAEEPTITSATYTLRNQAGSVVVDGRSCSISGGTMTASLLAADTEDESFGSRWLETWNATIGGVAEDYHRDGALVLARLHPCIGQTDLTRRNSELAFLIGEGVTVQPKIDEGFADLTQDLYDIGFPFWRVRSPSSFRKALIAKVEHLVYEDAATLFQNDPDRYQARADRRAEEYKAALDSLVALMDRDEDNTIDTTTETGHPMVVHTRAPVGRRSYSRNGRGWY